MSSSSRIIKINVFVIREILLDISLLNISYFRPPGIDIVSVTTHNTRMRLSAYSTGKFTVPECCVSSSLQYVLRDASLCNLKSSYLKHNAVFRNLYLQ